MPYHLTMRAKENRTEMNKILKRKAKDMRMNISNIIPLKSKQIV